MVGLGLGPGIGSVLDSVHHLRYVSVRVEISIRPRVKVRARARAADRVRLVVPGRFAHTGGSSMEFSSPGHVGGAGAPILELHRHVLECPLIERATELL